MSVPTSRRAAATSTSSLLAAQTDRTHTARVDIELLVVPDCPHQTAAAAVLRTALEEVGLARFSIAKTVMKSDVEAERRGFVGSPTILIDADPFADVAAPSSPACGLYPTADGLTGLPDLRLVRQALKRAAHDKLMATGSV
jgi:hypothetical protein